MQHLPFLSGFGQSLVLYRIDSFRHGPEPS